MPQLRPPTSFLLRGSAMLIALLILWWWVLLDPMLSALEGVGNVAGRLVFGGSSVELMRKESAGNWTFHVPKKILVPASAGNPALRINFIRVRCSTCGSHRLHFQSAGILGCGPRRAPLASQSAPITLRYRPYYAC
jgi:hypothetical protein